MAQSAYAQPRLDRPNDVRVLNETELLVSLGESFTLKLTFALGYDSLPPAGRRGLDTATKTSVGLRF
jgi:putative salt-induced outer membrane protein YdiY